MLQSHLAAQSIRPVLFGLKDLIRKLKLTAVGDTVACGRCNRKDWLSAAVFPRKPEAATAGRDKIDNEEADEVIDAIASRKNRRASRMASSGSK